MPLRVRSGFLGAAGPTGGGLSTEAECGIIGGKTGPDTGKGVTDAVLSLYLAALGTRNSSGSCIAGITG